MTVIVRDGGGVIHVLTKGTFCLTRSPLNTPQFVVLSEVNARVADPDPVGYGFLGHPDPDSIF